MAGGFEEQQAAFDELLVSLLLAILLVYMALACQYESFRDPIIVMMAVPFAAIGVVITLVADRDDAQRAVAIGTIMLGGIVVNNAILLVDQANRLAADRPLAAAIAEAGRRRLRPILMTTSTTILGLLPLAIGIGEGSEAQAPLARTVVGGLLASTLITLVLIPAGLLARLVARAPVRKLVWRNSLWAPRRCLFGPGRCGGARGGDFWHHLGGLRPLLGVDERFDMPTFGDATALLKDSEWLTRLARGLCGDRELAEDVAQETMLAAWQTRGGIRGALRPWLVGAVRRLIANRGRAEVRRWRRERSAEPRAGSNAVPATDEVVARAALQQDVVQEVMALDEPYRTAVLLRYFDDLSCREISARVGAPLETVRSRVKRGVLQLRERLDRRHGSRSAWLLPVASTFGTNVPSTSLGAVAAAAVMVILVNVKLLVVAAVAVVFGLLFWLPDAPLAAPSNAGGAAADGVASSEPAESTGVVGDASDTATPAPVDRVATADVAIEVFGRVLWDNGGEPVEGATVQLILPMSEDPGGGVAYVPAMDPNEPVPEERVLAELATKADGTFALQLRDPVAALQCIVRHDDAWAETSQVLRSRRGAAVDLGTLRLCEAVMIRGRVRDTGDRPVADTEVNVLPRNRRDTPDRWIASGRGYPPVTTDANGEFRLPRPLPTGEYWVYYGDRALEAVNSNFVVTRDDAFLDLRVHRGADVVRGVVVDADGEPVEGLAVSCTGGRSSGDTDSSGAFEVRRSRGGSATTTVSIWRHRFHIAELLSETEVDWGREDLRIELGPTVDLSVQVVQAPAMTPVEAFDLQLHRQGTRQWMPGGLRFSSGYSGGMRRGGVMRFEGMMPGRYRCARRASALQRSARTRRRGRHDGGAARAAARCRDGRRGRRYEWRTRRGRSVRSVLPGR